MFRSKNPKTVATLLATLAGASGLMPATTGAEDYRSQAIAMLKRDFQAKGIAGLDRLETDGLQAICNRTGNKPPKEIADRLV